MIRRPLWLGAGVAIGIGSTLWAEQKIKRAVDDAKAKMTPEGMAQEAATQAKALGRRARLAVVEARAERVRQEAILRQSLGGARSPGLRVVSIDDRTGAKRRTARQ